MVLTGQNRLEKTRKEENLLHYTCEKEGREKFRTDRIAKLGLARIDRTVKHWMG